MKKDDKPVMIRVRMEVRGKNAAEVSLKLAELAGEVRGMHGGEWEEEEPGISTIPTVKPGEEGTWGRLTIRRRTE